MAKAIQISSKEWLEQAVSLMVFTYFHLGKLIVEEEQ
jgi:hypothetical protein